ncbi:MAG: hypothetical protein J7M39_12685, partial [Anaerolineae bacterium]|nr:hypothetical protein [Anaerolineae bacterium]
MPGFDREDRPLKRGQVQQLSSANALAQFFTFLGYPQDTRLPMTAEALQLNKTLSNAVRRVERLVDVDGALQIYLFELTTVTVAHTRALARAFRDRAGDFLFVLTDDYQRIDFVLLDREVRLGAQATLVRPRILTVDRTDPDRVALRVLRRFTFTEVDEDGVRDPYAQFDKLKSAFTIAEWSEPLFNNRALFSDYYLNERLPDLELWDAPELNQVFRDIRKLFATARQRLHQDVAAAPQGLIRPVLQILGFRAEPGPGGTQANRLLLTSPPLAGEGAAGPPAVGEVAGPPA